MTKMFFAPDGAPITRVAAYSFNCPNVEVDEIAGTADLGHFDDFPDFSQLTVPGLGGLLVDVDGNEWLEQHCRLIETYDGYDPWDDDAKAPAWDDDIVDACLRVERLGQVLICVKQLRDWSPEDICEDATIAAVLDNIIVARIEGEMAGLLCRIDAYRAANPDVTVWPPETEETLDAVEA